MDRKACGDGGPLFSTRIPAKRSLLREKRASYGGKSPYLSVHEVTSSYHLSRIVSLSRI